MFPRPSLRPITRPRVLLLAVLALCVLGGYAAWSAWRQSPSNPGGDPDDEEVGIDGDPRLTFPTPYRNVRPEVKYVGDAACAKCHDEIVASYRQHPMGHSLESMDEVASKQRYGPEVGNPFQAGGRQFAVERRNGRVIHREFVPDDNGRPIVEAEDEVQYAIGATTNRTFSIYLIERDDCLFQSPISWYSQKERWNLSPGAKVVFEHFERRIKPACLFCHSNAVEPVANSGNRYHRPFFRGMTIGCERCHGPGELHVAHPGAAHGDDGADLTIVNPNRPNLTPALRDAVCQQCHLQGETRIGRRGRGVFDYRPGLPLHLFLTAFVKAEQSEDSLAFVSHAEQMQACRCATESKGAMSCTTCHDPHAYPSAEKREARHRAACVKCHGESGCKLPAAERAAKKDSCVACHMQRRRSTEDVQHTVITDHHIVRRPTTDPKRPVKRTARGAVPIVPFHADLGGLPKAERNYDLALGLLALVPERFGLREADLIALAKPRLEEALRRWPDDVELLEGRARAREFEGRFAEALADTKAVLALIPDREMSLLQAAKFSEALGRTADALAYVDRALAIAPSVSMARATRARLYGIRGEWGKAVADCRAVLRYNPTEERTRGLLVIALAKSGDKAQARAEFDKMMALKPADAERFRAMLAPLLR